MDNHQGIDEVSLPATWPEGSRELLVDTAISHLEKLRRVLMLEEWIRTAADDPLLAGTCHEWSVERERLLDELHLEPVADSRSGNAPTSP